jgi:hypothetical protein
VRIRVRVRRGISKKLTKALFAPNRPSRRLPESEGLTLYGFEGDQWLGLLLLRAFITGFMGKFTDYGRVAVLRRGEGCVCCGSSRDAVIREGEVVCGSCMEKIIRREKQMAEHFPETCGDLA